MAYCCADLDRLAHPSKPGLGLMVLRNRWGPRFILEYRQDWHVPKAEAALLFQFCPFCGTKPTSLMEESGSNSTPDARNA